MTAPGLRATLAQDRKRKAAMPMGQRNVTEDADMGITLSDGTRLSARVWRPDDVAGAAVPAILEFLPYRKRDGTCGRDALTHPYFASHGYACLRVDMRGNGDSDGVMTDEYTPQELADAVEVIDWIAAQDWCTGTVGMMGISWGGFNALQVAALVPKPLKAIITLCSTVDRFADDIHYKGGCLLNENLGWGATMLSYSSRAPDVALVGDRWREMWLERLQAEPHLPELWASHQHRDDYWKHGSVCEDFAAIRAATLAIGGWGDGYKNAVQTLVENLRAPVKGIVGPWIHKYPHVAVPEPRIGFLQEALRWWDKWLKGIETGVENDPDLRLFLMDSEAPKPWYDRRAGRWIDQDFRAAPRKVLHLGAAGLGENASPFTAVIDSPADTGMASGEYCAIWLGPELPGDQRRDDALSTCFETDILDGDIEIVGATSVTLTLASDTPVAQIAVRLNDVHPNGATSRITYGVLNLSHRDGSETPAPMPVAHPVEVTLNFDQIAYTIPAGHRLRLSISNAYWPLIWPAPGPTKLTLTAGQIALPLLQEGAGDASRFAPPEAAPPWRTRNLREPENIRETTFDQRSGITTLRIVDDFGEVEDLDHGLITGSIAREWWDIHPDDPLSARGRTHWSDTLARGDWRLRTETFSQMHADAKTFHITARIEAYEGDTLIFERDFSRKIPRDLV
jgi:uncharacterized protein